MLDQRAPDVSGRPGRGRRRPQRRGPRGRLTQAVLRRLEEMPVPDLFMAIEQRRRPRLLPRDRYRRRQAVTALLVLATVVTVLVLGFGAVRFLEGSSVRIGEPVAATRWQVLDRGVRVDAAAPLPGGAAAAGEGWARTGLAVGPEHATMTGGAYTATTVALELADPMPEGQGALLARWDESAGDWLPVASAVARDRGRISAEVAEPVGAWTVLRYDTAEAEQAGALYDGASEPLPAAPQCSGDSPRWIVDTSRVSADDPIVYCHDVAADDSQVTVRGVGNRGYAQWVRPTVPVTALSVQPGPDAAGADGPRLLLPGAELVMTVERTTVDAADSSLVVVAVDGTAVAAGLLQQAVAQRLDPSWASQLALAASTECAPGPPGVPAEPVQPAELRSGLGGVLACAAARPGDVAGAAALDAGSVSDALRSAAWRLLVRTDLATAAGVGGAGVGVGGDGYTLTADGRSLGTTITGVVQEVTCSDTAQTAERLGSTWNERFGGTSWLTQAGWRSDVVTPWRGFVQRCGSVAAVRVAQVLPADSRTVAAMVELAREGRVDLTRRDPAGPVPVLAAAPGAVQCAMPLTGGAVECRVTGARWSVPAPASCAPGQWQATSVRPGQAGVCRGDDPFAAAPEPLQAGSSWVTETAVCDVTTSGARCYSLADGAQLRVSVASYSVD